MEPEIAPEKMQILQNKWGRVGIVLSVGFISILLYGATMGIGLFSILLFSPYIVIAIISLKLRGSWAYTLGLLMLAIADFHIYASVAIWPASSTAGIAILGQPLFVFAAGIVGIGIGALIDLLTRKIGSKIGHGIGFIIVTIILVIAISSIFTLSDQVNSSIGISTDSSRIVKETNSQQYSYQGPMIDIDNDGRLEIIQEGGGFSDVGVMDANGEFIWTFQPHETVSPGRLTYGDVNRDGEIEFYVADFTGVYQLDINGNILWKYQPGTQFYSDGFETYADVEIIETETQSYVVALTGQNVLSPGYRFFDFNGNLIKTLGTYSGEFNFDVAYFMGQQNILLGYPGNNIVLLDLDGNVRLTHDLKNFQAYHGPTSISVKFDPNDEPYLVVLSESSSTGNSDKLSIFSPQGVIIYEENVGPVTAPMTTEDIQSGDQILRLGTREGSVTYRFTSTER